MSDATEKGRSTTVKILMPVVATAASAVASYLAKKAPQYLEQTVKPKLRETKESAGGAGDVARDLADRARSAVGRGDDSGDDNGSGGEPRSNDDLERRRRERAENRAARRKAS